MPAFKVKADDAVTRCKDVKLKFVSTKGNDVGEHSLFNVTAKANMCDILGVHKQYEDDNDIKILRGEDVVQQHFPFFMSEEFKYISLNVNYTKVA
eukprot:8195624-Heterocapsa_arctica.AAC.1